MSAASGGTDIASQAVRTSLGENIVLLRNVMEPKITQGELADRVGISRPTLMKIEQGDADPSISTIHAISRELNVPMFFLLIDKIELEGLLQIAWDFPNLSIDVDSVTAERMQVLSQSTRLKDQVLVAREGISVASSVGFTNAPDTWAASCAAIGAKLLADAGAIFGGAIGFYLWPRKNQ